MTISDQAVWAAIQAMGESWAGFSDQEDMRKALEVGLAIQAAERQRAAAAYVERRWPHLTAPVWRALKLAEEAGEVAGAVVKMSEGEGRKTLADVELEVSQVVVVCNALAETLSFSVEAAVEREMTKLDAL